MEKRCIYCGQPITKKPAAVWLKREKEEVQCCSMDCYNKTSRFIKWDQASRLKAYVIIGICAAVNLISIGFSMEGWWTHIPLVVIGMCLCKWPLVTMKNSESPKHSGMSVLPQGRLLCSEQPLRYGIYFSYKTGIKNVKPAK